MLVDYKNTESLKIVETKREKRGRERKSNPIKLLETIKRGHSNFHLTMILLSCSK